MAGVCKKSLLLLGVMLGSLIVANAGMAASAWDTEITSGHAAYQQGAYEDAARFWSRAEELARKSQNKNALAETLWLKAEAQRALGKHDDALVALDEALTLVKDIDAQGELHAKILTSFGDSLATVGNWTVARRILKRAVRFARKTGNDKILAVALNNLGNNLFKKGLYLSAIDAHQECSEVAKRSGNHLLRIQALSNIANANLLQDNLVGARENLTPAIAELRSLPASRAKIKSLIGTGVLTLKAYKEDPESANTNWLKDAYELLSEAERLSSEYHDLRSRSFATGYLGEIYTTQDRHEEALILTEKAIRLAQNADAPESEYIWQWQAAKIYKKQKNIDAAIASYRLAVEKIQFIRNELPTTTAFKEVLGPVFLELTDLLLQRPNSIHDAHKVEEYLKEARQTMELLKTAELQDYFQDNCVTALQSRTTNLDMVQDKTAILYPILLKDRLEILLSFSDGMQRTVVNIGADALREKINKFRVQLVNLGSDEYLGLARELYDILIRPMQSKLEARKIDTLVIVPDSALRTIPMAALNDGKQFLIAKYALAVTPGLTLTDARPLSRDNLEVLVSGLSESVQGFAALPNVALEIKNIKQDFANSTVLFNEDYSVKNVESELTRTNFNIVHIASHAQFSSKPEETFLLAHDEKFTMDRLEGLMNQTKYRDNPVELITLSACQTAAGDERAALGLAGVAIKAGARSALATLWFINDKASSLLVSEFYKQLKNPNTSKAKALQKAQLAIMNDHEHQHPLFWSPFLLIGNWL